MVAVSWSPKSVRSRKGCLRAEGSLRSRSWRLAVGLPWGSRSLRCSLAAGSALQFVLQSLGWNVPYQLFLALPYLLTLVALAGIAGRHVPPAALGRAWLRTS